MSASLISRIKRDSFIIFKSSNEDIELFGRKDKNFKFSHFALLNLPDIKQSISDENVMDFERIQSRLLTGNSVATPPAYGDSIDLSESFQNYMLNFENIATSADTYDRESLKNINERIFFKWLKEIGSIRFRNANTSESNVTERYCEESTLNYQKVVQYIGEISFQNKVSHNKNNYEEVLMMIPSQAGNTPTVLFKTVSDQNYTNRKAFLRKDSSNAEFIEGMSSTSTANNGLSKLAQYDIDVAGVAYTSVNLDTPSDTSLWFSYYSGTNAYLTDKTFTDPTTDRITATHNAVSKTYLRSRLDGVCLDLDKVSYSGMNSMNNKVFSEFANDGQSFDFNVVLLYYQLEKNGVVETNLFGVYFLDDVSEVSGGQSEIKRLPKIKNSALLGQSGNSYGFKLNFRVDAVDGNVVSDVSFDISDYNTFSMQLFANTMGKMTMLLENYDGLLSRNQHLLDKNQQLMDIVRQNNINITNQQLTAINQRLLSSNEFNTLSNMYAELQSLILSVLRNNTPVSASVILEPLGYDGIKADITGNVLKIGMSKANYTGINKKELSFDYGNTNEVSVSGKNGLVVFTSQNPAVAVTDINIYIDDSQSSWADLQSVIVVFDASIDLNGRNVNIFTDKSARFTQSSYGLQIASILGGKKIEITCIDSLNYTFIIS